jgi:twitching motility protein PilT
MQMIDLLRKLIELKGSDLHLMAGLHPAVRVHGELTAMTEFPRFEPGALKDLIYSILTEDHKRAFESEGNNRYELDFGYGVTGLGRFRINVHRQRGSISMAIRALAESIPVLADLGLPDSIRLFTSAKRGLVLVTGPTGSGKTTTLAALVDTINETRHDHIITIEDPIEYLHNSKKSYVTQREVGPTGDTMSFKNGLKYALRQDPDVILIGELRDPETIGIAITSAETGHLVFGTLHTSSAAHTIDRIVDVFPPEQQPQIRTQFAGNLLGIISQILLPRIDRPGRCLASELLIANFAIRNNIRACKTESIYQTLQTASAEGMQTMDQSLVKLCKEGKIDYETARPFVHDKSTHETLKLCQKPAVPRPAPGNMGQARPANVVPPWEKK